MDFNVPVLDKKLENLAKEQLNEDPNERLKHIQEIRQWLDQNNYTKRNDPRFILTFLRSWKFNLEETKNCLKAYHGLRRDYPNWFKWKDPSSPIMDALLNLGIYVMCSYNSATGRKVCICRQGVTNPSTTSFEDVLSLERMVEEVSFWDDQTQIMGYEVINDMKGFRAGHLKYYTPNVIRIYTKFMRILPGNVYGVHFINMPKIFNSVLSLGKRLLPSEIRNSFYVHNDVTSLYKFIPQDSLPEEYGGTAGPLSKYIGSLKEAILENKNYLQSIAEDS